MINGVEVSNPTCNFKADEWTSLGWNGGQAYFDQAREQFNVRGHGGQGGGHDGDSGYERGGGPYNVN